MGIRYGFLCWAIFAALSCHAPAMGERHGYWVEKRNVPEEALGEAVLEILNTIGMLCRKTAFSRDERIVDVQTYIPYDWNKHVLDLGYHELFWEQCRIELPDIKEDLAFMKALAVYLAARMGYQLVDFVAAVELVDRAIGMVDAKIAGVDAD